MKPEWVRKDKIIMLQNEFVENAVEEVREITENASDYVCKEDLVKVVALLGGWELSKGLLKLGYNKLIAPTKLGAKLSNVKASIIGFFTDKKAAKQIASEVVEEAK